MLFGYWLTSLNSHHSGVAVSWQKKTKDGKVREVPVTYEQYASMPDDGNRYELADGVLELMSPAPTVIHQMVSFAIQTFVEGSCRNEFIVIASPVDVILSDTEVRQPDLVVIHRSRMSIIRNRGIYGAPDLIVELMNEHSRRRDKVSKRVIYGKYRVPEYWILLHMYAPFKS